MVAGHAHRAGTGSAYMQLQLMVHPWFASLVSARDSLNLGWVSHCDFVMNASLMSSRNIARVTLFTIHRHLLSEL